MAPPQCTWWRWMLPWRAVPGYAHKGRNYATQHRTQRLDSALVCGRRYLIRGPCVRTSGQKETGGALTAHPHAAPSRRRSASAPLAPCPRPRLNAPGGAGCSLTRATCLISTLSLTSLNAPDGAGCSLSAQFAVTHTRDGITQHNTAHNGLIPPLCANDVA